MQSLGEAFNTRCLLMGEASSISRINAHARLNKKTGMVLVTAEAPVPVADGERLVLGALGSVLNERRERDSDDANTSDVVREVFASDEFPGTVVSVLTEDGFAELRDGLAITIER